MDCSVLKSSGQVNGDWDVASLLYEAVSDMADASKQVARDAAHRELSCNDTRETG